MMRRRAIQGAAGVAEQRTCRHAGSPAGQRRELMDVECKLRLEYEPFIAGMLEVGRDHGVSGGLNFAIDTV